MVDTSALVAALPPEQQRNALLEGIFMPEAHRQRVRFHGSTADPRFVHYTSAPAALSILEKRRFWLRSTTAMDDNMEVQLGFSRLHGFLSDQTLRGRFVAAVDAVRPGIAEAAIKRFYEVWGHPKQSPFTQTYIGSVSEHDPDEDLHGRLSMWRAFGTISPARLALVFRVPFASGAVDFLNCSFSPVAYLSPERARGVFEEVITNIIHDKEVLLALSADELFHWLFGAFVLAVTCMKHEGFKEEREWRIVYSPNFVAETRRRIQMDTEIVRGIPQFVHKFPLDESVAPEIAEIDVVRMFDRIILGPSWHPWVQYELFSKVLDDLRIENASQRVIVSQIPVRVL